MKSRSFSAVLGFALALSLTGTGSLRAEDLPADVKACINKGLDWMARNQNPDGHWEAVGGQYPVTMTALGGMTLLMEGSTIREGKYADRVRKAVDWLMLRSMPNGMLGNPNIPGEAGRYMYGHGFALLFLASVYGEEEEGDRRKKLEDILTRAAEFSGKAQTNRKGSKTGKDCGGWGYVSAQDGGNFDEGSVTITQLQGLRAARNAGIAVKKEIIDKAIVYLEECTNAQGGVIYSLGGGGGGDGRPALTAAAISCGFSAGEYGTGDNAKLIKSWIKFCQTRIPLTVGGARFGHDEYTHYYYAQAMYSLGETGYKRLFPEVTKDTDWLTWKKYKDSTFPALMRSQGGDGSWQGGHVGPVFITAVYLTILQLENAALPIYDKANN